MAMKKLSKKFLTKKHKQFQQKAKKHIILAKKKLIDVEKKVDGYIKHHPEKAAMIAAGVGVAIGAAVSAVLRKKKK